MFLGGTSVAIPLSLFQLRLFILFTIPRRCYGCNSCRMSVPSSFVCLIFDCLFCSPFHGGAFVAIPLRLYVLSSCVCSVDCSNADMYFCCSSADHSVNRCFNVDLRCILGNDPQEL